MTKIKRWMIDMIAKKYIVSIIGKIFSNIKGYKSQVCFILIVVIKFCLYMNFIPADFIGIANEIITALYGAVGISVGDKIRRYWEASNKAISETIENK